MASPLKKEFDYFLSHQDELVEKYLGRVVVIKDQNVVGDYGDEQEAISAMQNKGFRVGTFLVQKVEKGQDVYTQTFHSRVAFV